MLRALASASAKDKAVKTKMNEFLAMIFTFLIIIIFDFLAASSRILV